MSEVSRFAEFAAMFAEAEANARDLASAQDRIQNLEDELSYATRERDGSLARISELSAQLSEVARERDMFRQQYNDADALVSTLRGDYDASQALLGQAETTINRLRRESDDWMKKYEAAYEEMCSLHKELGCANSAISKVTELLMGMSKDKAWTHPEAPLPVPSALFDPTFHNDTLKAAPEVAPFPPMPDPFSDGGGGLSQPLYPENPSEVPPVVVPPLEIASGVRGTSDPEPESTHQPW